MHCMVSPVTFCCTAPVPRALHADDGYTLKLYAQLSAALCAKYNVLRAGRPPAAAAGQLQTLAAFKALMQRHKRKETTVLDVWGTMLMSIRGAAWFVTVYQSCVMPGTMLMSTRGEF